MIELEGLFNDFPKPIVSPSSDRNPPNEQPNRGSHAAEDKESPLPLSVEGLAKARNYCG
jgi:hypothetical protein